MSNSGHNRLLGIFMAACTTLAACQKDRPKPQWDLDILAPLIQTSLTIGDLVPDTMLATDGSGQVSILHTFELFSLSLDTVLTAPDTSFRYAYALPFPGPIQFQPGVTFDASDEVTRFDLDDLQLSKLIVRSGQVDVAITNMMNGHIIGDFALPGAQLEGEPFQVLMALPPGTPAAPSNTTSSRPLNGYVFDMRGPALNQVNSLATHLSYSNAPNGSTISITNMDSLLATVSYHGIVPEYALGYFGMRTIQVEPATTRLDLFENVSGTLDLDQVDATVKIRNGLGVDAKATIHHIRSLNTRTGTEVPLIASFTNNPVNIDRAADMGSTFSPSVKNIALDQGNSNIKQFLENLPDQIGYALDVTINPMGNISNGHDFLYHNSRVTAELEVNIPLRLSATGLSLRKVMEVDLPGTADAHAWQYGTMHLFAQNGFPFSAAIELAVVAPDGQSISVLAPGGTIPSATLGANGLVTEMADGRLDFRINSAQMNLLHLSGKVQVTAVFNTAEQPQHVQLLDSYRMDLKLTLDGNYVVNGDE